MASGRSYEQIDEMTLFDIDILFGYWRTHPTTEDILIAVYRIEAKKPESEKKIDPNDPSGFGAAIAAFPGGQMAAKR
jgi:hypothetical protein